jgi:hypothetical protein
MVRHSWAQLTTTRGGLSALRQAGTAGSRTQRGATRGGLVPPAEGALAPATVDQALVALAQQLPRVQAALHALTMQVSALTDAATHAELELLQAVVEALTARVETLETHRWEPLVGGEPDDPELIFADGELVWELRAVTD